MAEPDLIDRYVADLRRDIRWRSDADDVIDEVHDHLRETASALRAAGLSETQAQQRALARFGDPEIIHRAFAVTPSGVVALPTAFTRAAGAVAFLAALLWMVTAGLKWWESGLFVPWAHDQFVLFSIAVLTAAGVSLVVLIGMLARIGWPSPTAAISLGLAAIGMTTLAVAAWMWAILGLFLGVAFLLTVQAVIRMHERLRWLSWATAGGWFAGWMVAAMLSSAGLGPADEWGDSPMAVAIGFTIAALGMAVGLVGVGRWLTTERPAGPRIATA